MKAKMFKLSTIFKSYNTSFHLQITFSCLSAVIVVNIVMKAVQDEKADKDIKDMVIYFLSIKALRNKTHSYAHNKY